MKSISNLLLIAGGITVEQRLNPNETLTAGSISLFYKGDGMYNFAIQMPHLKFPINLKASFIAESPEETTHSTKSSFSSKKDSGETTVFFELYRPYQQDYICVSATYD